MMTLRRTLLATAAIAACLAANGASAAPSFSFTAEWQGTEGGVAATRSFAGSSAASPSTDPFAHPWAIVPVSATTAVFGIPPQGQGLIAFGEAAGGTNFVATGFAFTVVSPGLLIVAADTFLFTDLTGWNVAVAGQTARLAAPAGGELISDPFFPSLFALQVAVAQPLAAVPSPAAVVLIGAGLLGLGALRGTRRAGR